MINPDTDLASFLDKKVNLKTQSNKLPCLIFSYKSKCRMWWDLTVIIFALYNCVMIPIQVAFGDDFFSDAALAGTSYLDMSIDCFFFMDILSSFRTTYLNAQSGKEVTD